MNGSSTTKGHKPVTMISLREERIPRLTSTDALGTLPAEVLKAYVDGNLFVRPVNAPLWRPAEAKLPPQMILGPEDKVFLKTAHDTD